MQRDGAHQLHIERTHSQHAPRSLSHRRERLRQHIIHRLPVGKTPLKLIRHRAQVVVMHRLVFWLERVYLGDHRFEALQDLVVRVPYDL